MRRAYCIQQQIRMFNGRRNNFRSSDVLKLVTRRFALPWNEVPALQQTTCVLKVLHLYDLVCSSAKR